MTACCTDWDSVTKKDLQAHEQKRTGVADLRHIWVTKRQPFMSNHLERLAFIDETSVKINMVKATGWAPRGRRLVDHAPFGHWRTQTFIGALRYDRLDAPWVISGAMNSEMFDLYFETQLAPTLCEGDVVILDNLSSRRNPGAARALREVGAWVLFLPPYSPDLNPCMVGSCLARDIVSFRRLVGCGHVFGVSVQPVCCAP